MAESVDALVSKTNEVTLVPVRVRLRVQKLRSFGLRFLFIPHFSVFRPYKFPFTLKLNPVQLPTQMNAIFQDAVSGPLTARTCPVPVPKPGQVLIKMEAAPINPSDLYFLEGTYKFTKPYPCIPGLEGSGVVVASGGGWYANWLVGKKVGCSCLITEGGTWAEYMVTSPQLCVPLGQDADLEKAAMLLVNPLTAIALLEIAKKGGHSTVINTAGASALGKMMIRMGQQVGVTVIPVVRREAQVTELEALGAKHILNSSDPNFRKALRETLKSQKITLLMDAVAGEMTQHLLTASPSGSTVLLYGAMSNALAGIDPGSIIFNRKSVTGFYLTDWLAKKNLAQIYLLGRRVQKLLDHELKTDIHARVPFQDAQKGLELYRANMTTGKILFKPVV